MRYDAAVQRFVVQPHEITGADFMAEEKPDLKTMAVQWATGQPFNNVLLIAIFCGGAYAAHYLMTVAIPSHLKQIQEGYERIEESHKADRELIIRQYDKWFDSVIRTKEDSTGRVSPGEAIENIWHEGTLHGTDYENGQGVGFASDFAGLLPGEHGERIQIETKDGITVSWISSSVRRSSELRWARGKLSDGTGIISGGIGGAAIRDRGVDAVQKWWRTAGNRF